ncbi:MAG TPA: AI-2E family transporter [Acidimicrobiales bacterium]|nr:AI-2E family transporter [Acidimicrobiales bacterium]
MTERLRRAGQVAWALVGLAGVLYLLGVVASKIFVIFPPLILAGAIVFILNPLVTRLQRRGVPRAAGTGLAYALVLGALALTTVLVYPVAARQVDDLRTDWPDIQSRVERWVDDRAADSKGTFLEFSRQDIEDALSNNGTTLQQQLTQARKIGAAIIHVLLILLLGPILAFYLLVDLPHLRRVAESLVPEAARADVMTVARRTNRAIGGFFRGQLAVALLVGVLCSIGLGIIGVRFWFLIGMIAGLFNIIPLIGPWVGGIPGVTIALTTGSPLQALGVVVVMVVVQQIDNHFITPQVMQRAVQLHPAAVILALLAGGSIGGFFGLLLAVPVAAVLKILIGHLWHVHVLGEPLEPLDAGMGPGVVEDVDRRPENLGDGEAGDGEAGDAAQAVLRP